MRVLVWLLGSVESMFQSLTWLLLLGACLGLVPWAAWAPACVIAMAAGFLRLASQVNSHGAVRLRLAWWTLLQGFGHPVLMLSTVAAGMLALRGLPTCAAALLAVSVTGLGLMRLVNEMCVSLAPLPRDRMSGALLRLFSVEGWLLLAARVGLDALGSLLSMVGLALLLTGLTTAGLLLIAFTLILSRAREWLRQSQARHAVA